MGFILEKLCFFQGFWGGMKNQDFVIAIVNNVKHMHQTNDVK